MGGIIILASIIIPTLCLQNLIISTSCLCLLQTIWLVSSDFIDDYIKIFKKNKEGLAGKFKIAGQDRAGNHCCLAFTSAVM